MKDKWKLGFHLEPPQGWLNDPNGLCQFRGEYHVFFQYAPESPLGGTKCWGHFTSRDLLEWEFAGTALAPEKEFERNGVYSGSALVWEDTLYLYYTGNVKYQGDYNYITDGREGNTVLVTSRDGRKFGEKQLLLTNQDYPADLTCHVRDPKTVTVESTGDSGKGFYLFLGARNRKEEGEVLVYHAETPRDWTLKNRIRPETPFGYMWECPDAFCLEGKKYLCVSPQGVERQGMDYQNLYQSGYYLLEGEFGGDYTLGAFREWDKGFDFYAPQTFQDETGRRLLVGWIGMPDEPGQTNPTVDFGRQNALTVMRELHTDGERILQQPVEELKELRREEKKLEPGEVSPEMDCYDTEITCPGQQDVEIWINGETCLSYDSGARVFALEFTKQDGAGYGRARRDTALAECRSIRMLMDTSCMEIYVNGGEEVFTSRFYTGNGKSSFCLKGEQCQARYWELERMQIK